MLTRTIDAASAAHHEFEREVACALRPFRQREALFEAGLRVDVPLDEPRPRDLHAVAVVAHVACFHG
jgi:hypothetical protein